MDSFKRFFLGLRMKIFFFVFLILMALHGLSSGEYVSWNFEDCDIKDILFSISLDSGRSIVTDDSVSGRASLHFAGSDFDEAFDAFLKGNRLCVYKDDKVWTVSKARVSFENGQMCLDAYDLGAEQILEKISILTGWSFSYETLPLQKISVHFRGSEKEVFEYLARRFGNYDARIEGKNCFFARKTEVKNSKDNSVMDLECLSDGSFFVNVRDVRIFDVMEFLFGNFGGVGEETKTFDNSVLEDLNANLMEETSFVKKNLGYCFLAAGDSKIQRAKFYAKNFDDLLDILCHQNGLAFSLQDDIYYIFPDSSARDEIILGERKWNSFSLKYESVQNFLPLLSKRFGSLETLSLPQEGLFLCKCNDEEKNQIEELISFSDVQMSIYVVNLKYKKPSEFMEHLPPYIEKASLFLADDSKSLYFRGTEDSYRQLCSQIHLFDVPEKRLSYDLLILQYDQMNQNDWSSSFNVKKISMGDRNSISTMLGSVMAFNLNVVTAFGLTFAAELQASIENNHTKVFADTTLHGVSGKQINFQNTNTYRYRDNNLDPTTGKPVYSGVTKEIVSGIKLDVVGYVSGNGLITSKVTASVSRRGTDTSSSTGNPPPTTEKIITTEVSGKSGEPVILSGLVMNSESESEKGVPFISKIPFLGKLFQSKSKSEEKSQMVIYLVPHFENEDEFFKDNVSSENEGDENSFGKRYGEKSKEADYDWAERKITEFKEALRNGIEEEVSEDMNFSSMIEDEKERENERSSSKENIDGDVCYEAE